jgi:multidrug efflux system membrane fusion protein
MKTWKLWLSASTVLAAALLAGCIDSQANAPTAPPPPQVSVAAVVSKQVTQWDEFSGRVQAVDSVEIRPRVGGSIDKVNFIEGGEVHKNDVLFVIDQRPYRAELARAEADLARARSQAELTRTEVARAETLAAAHALSTEERDARAAAATQAGAYVRAAEAALEVARLNLEFTEVRSPIDGRVGQALLTAGNLIGSQPSATLLTTVVSIDPVYVYFEGDEQTYLRYAEMARRGERPSSRDARNPVFVGLANEDGYPHQGYMNFVDNQLNPATGTIRARAVVANPDRALTPGLFARVKLLGSGEFHALLIDDKAVLTDQDRRFVYVLGADNKAERRDVVLGREIDGLRVVEQGLKEGDQVIVHGVQKIFFPGMQVQPEHIAMGDGPAAPVALAATAAKAPKS